MTQLLSATDLLQPATDITLTILDASVQKIGQSSPLKAIHIPGAMAFDFQTRVVDPNSPLKATMASEAQFQQHIRDMGIGQEAHIVVYDQHGIYSAPRVWWMFKTMGFERIWVLDGGLPAYQALGGRVIEQAPPSVTGLDSDFVAQDQGRILSLDGFLQFSGRVIDARARPRYFGEVPEPRAGVASGHIPGAWNLPFEEVLDQGHLKQPDSLKAMLAPYGQTQDPICFYCGSGVTACILALAAQQLGYQNLFVYDGSWAQWGADPSLAFATGQPQQHP